VFRTHFLLLASSWLCACLLDDVDPVRSLRTPTFIAIIAEPPEAAPGEAVHYRALVASPEGPGADLEADWSFCRSPRPLSENGAVSVPCATERELPLAANGLGIDASIPGDGCARFGPEASAGLRPSEPDQSGGYYQPVRVALGGLVALHRHRIRCALADAPLAIAQRFQREYQRNRAPGILELQAAGTFDDRLSAGRRVELQLALAPDAAEQYLVYDRREARLVSRMEQLDVRWFASAGEVQTHESVPMAGRAAALWTAPASPNGAWIWVVVRDERGGVSVVERRFEVDSM
jgi:hypothetical protein